MEIGSSCLATKDTDGGFDILFAGSYEPSNWWIVAQIPKWFKPFPPPGKDWLLRSKSNTPNFRQNPGFSPFSQEPFLAGPSDLRPRLGDAGREALHRRERQVGAGEGTRKGAARKPSIHLVFRLFIRVFFWLGGVVLLRKPK